MRRRDKFVDYTETNPENAEIYLRRRDGSLKRIHLDRFGFDRGDLRMQWVSLFLILAAGIALFGFGG